MKVWKDNIRKVNPYVPGEQPDKPDMIKLNTNENPYPPSPNVIKFIKEINENRFSLYPDPNCKILVNEIAKFYKVNPDKVFVGVGSDDVLAMAFLTFFNSNKPIIFPDITYSFYPVWSNLYKIPYITKPLNDDFHIVKEDYITPNGGIVIANPNAPTAIFEDLEVIEEILINNRDVIVIVDEAYIDFGGRSALELTDKYDNLLIVQTFSKSRSMAGMRIGFAIGNKELIEALNIIKHSYNSYTMNYPSLVLGVESLKDEKYFRSNLQRVMDTRERTKIALSNLGFVCTDSKANFLFVTHPKKNASDIFQALREANIFVRYFKQDRIDNYLRITIGTDQQMDELLRFLKGYLLGN